MNRGLISDLVMVFCLGCCVQNAQAGWLFKKKSKTSESADTSNKKKKSLFENLFKSKKTKDKHSTKMSAETVAGKIISFETYVAVLASWKADKDAIKRAEPLKEAVSAFYQGNQPANSVDRISAVLQSGDPGVLRDDYLRTAIILAERLLRNNLNILTQSVRQTANDLQRILTYIIGTHYATKGDHSLLDDVQKEMK